MANIVSLRQRLIGAIALALASGAILAGGAQADRPDDRPGMLGVGGASTATAVPDVTERAVVVRNAPARPDDRSGARGPGVIFAAPRLGPVVASKDAFRWQDATVGAGAMFGVFLLAGGLALAIRHRGRVILP